MSIRDFFKPATALKRASEPISTSSAVTTNKRAKADESADNTTTAEPKTSPRGSSPEGDSSTLSPEQAKRAEESKQRALELLQQKRSGENDKLTAMERTTIHSSWMPVLKAEFKKPYFVKLKTFLEQEASSGHKIYPPEEDVYSWTRLCPFDRVRVVILGQDPYHNDNQAHGLAFSVRRHIRVPPSLVNIYKELESSVKGFKTPNHGNLEGWSRQGVLLLNATLTVRAHTAASHSGKGWEEFTDAAIKRLSAERSHLVFLLWGRHAQAKGKSIDKKKHLVLESAHPSPFSADRFFGCNHFNKANEYLIKHKLKPIDWNAFDFNEEDSVTNTNTWSSPVKSPSEINNSSSSATDPVDQDGSSSGTEKIDD